jgi:hypothetical protein
MQSNLSYRGCWHRFLPGFYHSYYSFCYYLRWPRFSPSNRADRVLADTSLTRACADTYVYSFDLCPVLEIGWVPLVEIAQNSSLLLVVVF